MMMTMRAMRMGAMTCGDYDDDETPKSSARVFALYWYR